MKIENRSPRHIQTTVFTATAAGDKVGDGDFVTKEFTIQVKATGAVTSWTVLLEGSLDGVNFDTILTHTDVTPGDGKLMANGSAVSPELYFRAKCTALALGAGTGITATVLGL